MGDTETRTTRRFTIVRRWCGDLCRDADKVRSALREADRMRKLGPSIFKPSDPKTAKIRIFPPAPGPAMQNYPKHWIRNPGPTNAFDCAGPNCPMCAAGHKRKPGP